jgi:hypothetical protein
MLRIHLRNPHEQFRLLSMTMDPWLTVSAGGREERPTLKFEDNFEPSDRLPDSVEYLASLGSIFNHSSFVSIFILHETI